MRGTIEIGVVTFDINIVYEIFWEIIKFWSQLLEIDIELFEVLVHKKLEINPWVEFKEHTPLMIREVGRVKVNILSNTTSLLKKLNWKSDREFVTLRAT